MNIIVTRNVTKRFPGVLALDDVSTSFEKGKIHCIIGENGAGKSTLIKILKGIYMPDEGDVFINGENALDNPHLFDAVSYVPQELNQFENMTVADNLFIPYEKTGYKNIFINKSILNKRALPWLEKFQINVSPDQLLKDIPISDQQLLQIARAMVDVKSKILMLDEPTTSLATDDIQRLFNVILQIKDTGKTIIFISHKLDEDFALADHITVLRNGVKVADSKASEVDMPWAIHQMTGKEIDQTINYSSANTTDDVLLEVRNLTADKFHDVSFSLRRGEILGFAGLIGSGRSEIMQSILGYLPVWSGSVWLNGKAWKFNDPNFAVNHGYIYLPADRKKQSILPLMNVRHNATITLLDKVSRFFTILRAKENSLASDIIKAYDIKIASMEQEIKFLSGGNQQKVIIGRSMFTKPEVLVCDEPTKGIDVSTKAEIYKIMKKLAEQEGIGIILISSELDELFRCANRIVAMYKGRIVSEFDVTKSDKKDVLNAIMGIVLH